MDATYLIGCKDENGERREHSLTGAAGLPFHNYHPVRETPSYRGQRHLPGLYWFASTGTHVLYESRLELSVLTLLDFDPEIAKVAAQPFRLSYSEGRKRRNHVPDYFAKLYDGRERVVDVKRAEQARKPEVRKVFAATREACRIAGWEYVVSTEPQEPFLSNVRWLAGFRRRPMFAGFQETAEALVEACSDAPRPVSNLVHEVANPALSRPALFHLLWRGVLIAPLHERMSHQTLVELPDKG